MDKLSRKEELVTDLIYLRKDRGMTTGRLVNASVVVDACGGAGEQLDVIRLRLAAAILSLQDQTNSEALRAAYGLLQETDSLPTLAERRKAYGAMVGRKYDTLADREDAAIEELANVLISGFYAGALQSLGTETLSETRQLYRYGQEALLYIEAFDVMATIVSGLKEADAGPIYRLALAAISNESHFTDAALWAFANCHSALRRVLHHRDGVEFLSTGLPTIWWDQKLNRPVQSHLLPALELALCEARDADDFGRRLRGSSDGSALENSWRGIISAPYTPDAALDDYVGERGDLRTRLVALCQFLARVFPEDTRPYDEMLGNYGLIIFESLSLVGEYATIRAIPDDTQRVERAIKYAIVNPPSHHIFGGKEACVL